MPLALSLIFTHLFPRGQKILLTWRFTCCRRFVLMCECETEYPLFAVFPVRRHHLPFSSCPALALHATSNAAPRPRATAGAALALIAGVPLTEALKPPKQAAFIVVVCAGKSSPSQLSRRPPTPCRQSTLAPR